MWPSDEHLLTEFGIKKVDLLKIRAIACLNKVALIVIDEKWEELQVFWKHSLFHFKIKDMWKFVLKTNNEKFSNLSHLFEVLLILPNSNATLKKDFPLWAESKLNVEVI